jgi:NHL repeat-containing protein
MRRVLFYVLLALLLSLLLSGEAAGWPPALLSQSDVSGGYAMTIDAHGAMFAVVPGGTQDYGETQGYNIVKYSASGTLLAQTLTGGGGSFQAPEGIAVDAQGNVYLADTYASRIQLFDNNLVPIAVWAPSGWLEYPEDIEIGADQRVYVKTQKEMQVFSLDGEPLLRWPATGAIFSIEPNGNLLIAEQGVFHRYSADGTFLRDLGGTRFFAYPRGLLTYPGAILVTTGAPGDPVLAFDTDGVYRGSFDTDGTSTLLARGPQDEIYVDGLTRYAPPGTLPQAPVTPPSPSSAVMLHISPVKSMTTACSEGPHAINEIVTKADANPDGSAQYFVYLLAAPRSLTDGIRGVQLGIQHTGSTTAPTALRIVDWRSCSDWEVPDDTWPNSGGGNTLTWLTCRYGALVTVGIFSVTAYAPASMGITGFPPTGVVKTADCDASEDVSDETIGFDRVGWVSMGGAGRGLDRDGCNPALESCVQQPVPVRPTTWGRVKNLYGH